VWALLTGVAGFCRPWSDLALHAAIGIFVSTLARSPGPAVAASYATIMTVRVTLYMATSLLGVVLMVPGMALALDAGGNGSVLNATLAISSLTALGVVLIQFVAAASLVWAAVWWLKRT
jgi:hypothetical protein